MIFSCRRKEPDEPPDSCRVHGSLSLNKVAGNFHVTAGKSLPLMRGHAHLAAMMGERDYNFREDSGRFALLALSDGNIQISAKVGAQGTSILL